jgi:hypothetical protein
MPALDPVVVRLANLFRGHPVWMRAAALLSAEATSNVRFRHRPNEVWHLARVHGVTELLPGASPDADLELCFPSGAVERLARTRGGIATFALVLFELAMSEDPALHVGVRALAPFARLVERGYLRLLLAGGPPVLAWGAAHGVRTFDQLRRWISDRGDSGLSAGSEMEHDPGASARPEETGAWRSAVLSMPPRA